MTIKKEKKKKKTQNPTFLTSGDPQTCLNAALMSSKWGLHCLLLIRKP